MYMCSYNYCYSSRSAGCYTTHTAGGSNHRLGVHLLDTEEETKTKCEDKFKVKMYVLMTKKIEYYANSTKNDSLIGCDHKI